MAAIAMSCKSVEEADPCKAVDDVLTLVHNLIGARKDRWLNSFKLIGLRSVGTHLALLVGAANEKAGTRAETRWQELREYIEGETLQCTSNTSASYSR